MRKSLTSALAGLMLMAAPLAASAGEGEGVISDINLETRMIVLEDGSNWVAAETVDLRALAPGDRISVIYEDGTTILTQVTKVE